MRVDKSRARDGEVLWRKSESWKGYCKAARPQLNIGLTFRLQRLIHLLDIAEIVLPLE